MEEIISECSICCIKTTKAGNHFGALTCLKCRSFFRRAPERKRAPRCKLGGICPIDQTVKTYCDGCRYNKCLSAGMKPERVLNEEERKNRFRQSLSLKKLKRDKTGATVNNSIVFPIESSRSPTFARNPRMVPFESFNTSTISSFIPTASVSPMAHFPVNAASASSKISMSPHSFTEMPYNPISDQTQYIETAVIQRVSVIVRKPLETGMSVIKMVEKEHVSEDIDDYHSLNSKDLIEVNKEDDVFISQETERTEMEYIHLNNLEKSDSILNEGSTNGSIEVVLQEDTEIKRGDNNDDESQENQMILNYIHKKFDQVNLMRKESTESQNTSQTSMEPFRKKRVFESVITLPYSLKTSEIENKKYSNIRLDIDFAVFNGMGSSCSLQEANLYIEKTKYIFEKTKNEINLGQDHVTEFIKFCKSKGDFTAGFWKRVSMMMRERYLNFVCSLDLMEEIPQKTVYNLLKQNLGKAEMLTYVFVFNAPGWDEELDFVWGQTDKNQWKARDATVDGIPFNTMLQYMPMRDDTKFEMLKTLLSCCRHIFSDITVIIFMLLLTIFDQDGDKQVENIRRHLMSKLSLYLQENSDNHVSLDLHSIINCIETLPRMLRILLEMTNHRGLESDSSCSDFYSKGINK